MSTNCWNYKTEEQIEGGMVSLPGYTRSEFMRTPFTVTGGLCWDLVSKDSWYFIERFKVMHTNNNIARNQINKQNESTSQILSKRTMSLNGIYSRVPVHRLELFFFFFCRF